MTIRRRHDDAVQLDAPRLHALEAGDGAQHRGLAAPEQAQQAADVTGLEHEIDGMNDFGLAIGDADSVEFELMHGSVVPG